MKAEHRKELQTNTLAAGMGRLVQRIKTKPQRRTVLWVALGAIAVLLIAGYLLLQRNRHLLDSQLWLIVDLPSKEGMSELKVYPNKRQSQAAEFQLAHLELWEIGIKGLPSNPDAYKAVLQARGRYEKLAEEAKDDPILGAEARYNLAVAQESLAVLDPKTLDEAVRLYKKVDDEHPKTARAADARERLKLLEGKESRREIEQRYLHLRVLMSNQFPLFHPPTSKEGGKARAAGP